MSRLTIIVAATQSNGIGKASRLPWRIPKEMKYFSQVTSTAPEGHRNAVIMGRNTWESIPKKFRPLANRVNIVTTRNENYKLDLPEKEPALLLNSLISAVERVSSGLESKPIHRIFIIGGASLYAESLTFPADSSGFVDRILLTRIISPDFNCDAFMPDFLCDKEEGKERWERVSHDALSVWVGFDVPEGVQEENGVEYEFQMWVRER